jgi:hypothetical protein
MSMRIALLLGSAVLSGLASMPARAHITPPVVLASDREAVARLLPAATRYFVREVRPSPAEQDAIRRRTGWNADDDFYRFYVGRTAEGALVAATVFLSEFTLHGPVRVAVAVGPDGKVTGASVVEVTEESYTWVKPVLDSGFLQRFVGRDARSALAQTGDVSGSMPRFYAGVIASLIARAASLYEVTMPPK